MKKEIIYDTIKESKEEKKRLKDKWRVLHTDFINNKVRVTFVNGDDDPTTQGKQQKRILRQKRKQLESKLQDNSLTFEELKEYLRLR